MLHLGERCLVMGILNASPDSFAERQGFRDPASAADFALRMESEGADLIDIGGESTRPGAEPVSADQELARVLPVVAALQGRLRVPISIDTYKAEVARAAVAAGAALVNDVSGLRVEPGLAREVAAGGAALVLVGPSRKSFLREAVGGRPAAERDWGTAAAVTAAVLAGAHIVRVHAIAEMVQVVRVAEEIRKHG